MPAAGLDAGYEDNADLVIGEGGIPTLKRRRGAGTPAAAEQLAEAIARRMPERSLLGIVARTAHWLGWHHHFGPASGSDPKISDPRGRYCLAVFTGGVSMGPYEAAQHIAGVSARELSMVRNRHIDLKELNAAIGCVVNAFAELDVVKARGRRNRGGRRRHPGGDLHRQPAGRDQHQIRKAWAASPTTTSPTPTSRCSPGSSRAGCGRRCT